MNTLRDENILGRPQQADHHVSPWLDEQIWGHRLHDAQTPWLLFLEFLTVAEACHREDRLFEGGEAYPLNYMPRKRMYLRNILFNSEFLSQAENGGRDSNAAWRDWIEWMKNRAQAVPNRDFSYLKPRFREFKQFASLVATVRSSAVESDTNRRWTSRFVFPFGSDCLYEDLSISKNGNTNREYINFGRTGELLYLMLCRSSKKDELQREFSQIFETPNQWNTLIQLFQPDNTPDSESKGKSYLPYRKHPGFDRLAEDWISIFNLRLPGFDAFDHLVRLGALHVMLYQLHIAAEVAGLESTPSVICEAIAPRKTLVRELSATNYQDNNALPARAVESYIDGIENSVEWKTAVAEAANEADAFARCRRILEREVWWGEDYDSTSDPTALIADLRDTALKRHRRHVGSVHRVYGREIGLVSKRGTNKLRYAPTDGLLKTLVLANVPRRMELSKFLERLFYRYGIVFDDEGAAQALPGNTYDRSVFKRNLERLEQRLSSLGMLRRLSDSCAYVENPHTRKAV